VGWGWVQSATPGSLMMHPVFGRTSLLGTGINELSVKQKEFVLYPNPAQDKIYISTRNEKTNYTQVEIMSALGQTILKDNYNSDGIDISHLESGIYFIYLSSSGARSTPEKLIISR